MQNKQKILLLVDGIANLIIGIILLLFPLGLDNILGLPIANNNFYPSILGAVIFGIGIALLIEIQANKKNISGLGIAGAIVINFCGGLTLLTWLIFFPLNIPIQGFIILLIVAVIVLSIGIIETLTKS